MKIQTRLAFVKCIYITVFVNIDSIRGCLEIKSVKLVTESGVEQPRCQNKMFKNQVDWPASY